MKRSFLTVLAMSSLLVVGACASADDDAADATTDAGAVPAPVTPPPAPLPADSGTMPADSMNHDSTGAATTTTGL